MWEFPAQCWVPCGLRGDNSDPVHALACVFNLREASTPGSRVRRMGVSLASPGAAGAPGGPSGVVRDCFLAGLPSKSRPETGGAIFRWSLVMAAGGSVAEGSAGKRSSLRRVWWWLDLGAENGSRSSTLSRRLLERDISCFSLAPVIFFETALSTALHLFRPGGVVDACDLFLFLFLKILSVGFIPQLPAHPFPCGSSKRNSGALHVPGSSGLLFQFFQNLPGKLWSGPLVVSRPRSQSTLDA